jgi:hypothetical protein
MQLWFSIFFLVVAIKTNFSTFQASNVKTIFANTKSGRSKFTKNSN